MDEQALWFQTSLDSSQKLNSSVLEGSRQFLNSFKLSFFLMILPWAGQYLWAKKERCCGCVRGVLTGASQNGRSRSCLLYFYFDFVFHLTGKKVFFRALPKQITPWLQRLQRVLLDVSLASFPGQFDRKYKTTKTLQSALAMVGSASGSLCPASPRAAHNLREGWSRAAWYFRFSTKS